MNNDLKFYYNIIEETSYISYKNKLYKIVKDDIVQINQIELINQILDNTIIHTCNFYHIIKFLFNEYNNYITLQNINVRLFNKKFYFTEYKEQCKLIGIKKTNENEYDYTFIKCNGMKFVVTINL